jgi:hypothetical protein
VASPRREDSVADLAFCQGKATGTFVYENLSASGTFSGIVSGPDAACCGATTGSFQWINRR